MSALEAYGIMGALEACGLTRFNDRQFICALLGIKQLPTAGKATYSFSHATVKVMVGLAWGGSPTTDAGRASSQLWRSTDCSFM